MTQMNFGSMPVEAFRLIYEFIDYSELTPKQILSMRLVSRSVDECMYELWLRKTSQLCEKEKILKKEKFEYEPEGLEKELFQKLNSITDRMEDTYEECNTNRATIEFYTFAKPPDYIYRIGEAILEITCQIPLRTPFESEPSDATPESRAARWKVIREGWRDPEVILKMYERFDVNKLTEDHFSLLAKIEKDH